MIHGRRDSTHAEVRDELRALGASVADTGDAGHDFPDLVVGVAGATFLVEVKAAKGKLSGGQSSFARTWRGSSVLVLRSREQAREWLIRTRHELHRQGQVDAHRALTPLVVSIPETTAERFVGRHSGISEEGD